MQNFANFLVALTWNFGFGWLVGAKTYLFDPCKLSFKINVIFDIFDDQKTHIFR